MRANARVLNPSDRFQALFGEEAVFCVVGAVGMFAEALNLDPIRHDDLHRRPRRHLEAYVNDS